MIAMKIGPRKPRRKPVAWLGLKCELAVARKARRLIRVAQKNEARMAKVLKGPSTRHDWRKSGSRRLIRLMIA